IRPTGPRRPARPPPGSCVNPAGTVKRRAEPVFEGQCNMLTPVAPARYTPLPGRSPYSGKCPEEQEDPHRHPPHPDPETPPHQPPGSTRNQVVAAAKGRLFLSPNFWITG